MAVAAALSSAWDRTALDITANVPSSEGRAPAQGHGPSASSPLTRASACVAVCPEVAVPPTSSSDTAQGNVATTSVYAARRYASTSSLVIPDGNSSGELRDEIGYLFTEALEGL